MADDNYPTDLHLILSRASTDESTRSSIHAHQYEYVIINLNANLSLIISQVTPHRDTIVTTLVWDDEGIIHTVTNQKALYK